MIVIDVGCATWGGDTSVRLLLHEYHPDVLYGFDPGLEWPVDTVEDGTRVILERKAAWTHDGSVGFVVANLGGHIEDADRAGRVKCIDLAGFITNLGPERIILKMDAEGAEYDLVPHLVSRGADKLLALAMIEWHCAVCGYGIWQGVHPEGCTADWEAWLERRDATMELLRCPQEEWNR